MPTKLASLVLPMLLTAAVAMAATAPATAATSSKSLDGVTSVSAGFAHTCAVAKKRAYCWGDNYGQLGDGTVTPSKVPIRVFGLRADIRDVAAAGSASCASTRVEVKCWGEIKGNAGYAYTPRSVYDAESPVTAIDVGDGTNSGTSNTLCVISGATLGCKDLAPDEPINTVNKLGGPPSAVAVGSPRCAIVDGAAKCWGFNAASFDPSVVTGLGQGVTAIASGPQHTCAVVNAAAKCWGMAWGTPTPIQRSELPFDVPGLGSGVTAIAAGDRFSCAVVNGGVRCWGWNYRGQLGDGTILNSATPVPVKGLSQGVTAIAAGGMHACAIAARKLRCWGTNAHGQLGNGKRGARGIDASIIATRVVAPGRRIRARGHRQAAAGVDVGYDDSGVGVRVSYGVPRHMWVKDACRGSVSISVSGNGFKKESGRKRFRYENLSCDAHVAFGPRPAEHDDVVVRITSKGSKVLKPIRIKKTVRHFQCWASGCP